ncbi:hypothetical protein CYMTET_34835 [Cymbomonas tetramitiformis]|uniref:Uncharacterized protein n=1 Tax=Cymbomonas tetramitiformis TaxID=36881 RepID=A0AAE0KPS5_9CHLO|nr:hypothetical protein CYMTET_34835 [Cymbomonas tetramitiformis]
MGLEYLHHLEALVGDSLWDNMSPTQRLALQSEVMADTLRLENSEGRGPRTKGGSVFSAAALVSLKSAMTRVDMYEQFAVSAFPQHRLVPGKKLFGVLDVWRVNGRGSLANERTHSVWKKLHGLGAICRRRPLISRRTAPPKQHGLGAICRRRPLISRRTAPPKQHGLGAICR